MTTHQEFTTTQLSIITLSTKLQLLAGVRRTALNFGMSGTHGARIGASRASSESCVVSTISLSNPAATGEPHSTLGPMPRSTTPPRRSRTTPTTTKQFMTSPNLSTLLVQQTRVSSQNGKVAVSQRPSSLTARSTRLKGHGIVSLFTCCQRVLTGEMLMDVTTCPGLKTSIFLDIAAPAGPKELPVLLLIGSTF
jgi:hypothetical protein